MRQVWIRKAGGPEVLQVQEAPDPEPGAKEVRVRVAAAGINFADLMARMGLYPDGPPLPCVMGYEVAGVIDRIGAEVPDSLALTLGQRVLAMPRFGGYTDLLTIDARQVLPMPESMSFEEGAAFPVAFLTAHHTLLFTGNLREGSTVLIHSVGGALGLAALQLARQRNCRVIGTASPAKHEALRALGCQHPLDSGASDLPQRVRAIAPGGVDVILDPVGGPSWGQGFQLLAPCGRLVVCGLSAAIGGQHRNWLRAGWAFLSSARFNPMELMAGNRTVSGTNMAALFDRLDLLLPQLNLLLKQVGEGQLKVQVARSFPFAEAGAAHAFLHSRQALGKVVLVP